LALPEKDTNPLQRKALDYLHKFWKQLFTYRNDGEYTIDNMAAERAIRFMMYNEETACFSEVLRSTSIGRLQYFIKTCKQVRISFQQFFCKYLVELKKGQTDYEACCQ